MASLALPVFFPTASLADPELWVQPSRAALVPPTTCSRAPEARRGNASQKHALLPSAVQGRGVAGALGVRSGAGRLCLGRLDEALHREAGSPHLDDFLGRLSRLRQLRSGWPRAAWPWPGWPRAGRPCTG